MSNNINTKISTATIAHTVVLVLALLNQVLSVIGKSPLPIESTDIEQLISLAFTIGAALVSWWENNSFTPEAIQADKLLNEWQKRKK